MQRSAANSIFPNIVIGEGGHGPALCHLAVMLNLCKPCFLAHMCVSVYSTFSSTSSRDRRRRLSPAVSTLQLVPESKTIDTNTRADLTHLQQPLLNVICPGRADFIGQISHVSGHHVGVANALASSIAAVPNKTARGPSLWISTQPTSRLSPIGV